MAVVHAKQDTRGVVTGTVSVFNSQGTATTRAASDLVQASDWNGGHAEPISISSNTAGDASSFGAATNVVLGATGGMQVNLSTAANAATAWISRVESGATMSDYEPISGSAIITNSSLGQSSIYFVPFYVSKDVYVSRVNFFLSLASTVSAGNNSGTAGYTLSAALYTRMTAAGSNERISSMWSMSAAVSGRRSSNTNLQLTNVVGISNSTRVSTVATTLATSNATTYVRDSMAGFRCWALPMNSTLTPGRYWMAVGAQSTGSSNAARMGFNASVGMQTVGGVAQIGYVPVGTSSSASDISLGRIWQGAGTYSAQSAAFPGSVPLTSDSIRAGLTLSLPCFNFSGYGTASSIL